MPIANGLPLDLSICIPTFNRPALLRQCLSHLRTFSSFKFEVIVGDNAPSDDTRRVISEYANAFVQLTHVRHDTNIGAARNFHSVLTLARGRYAYVVADDDIVFENGLSLLKTALDSRPNLLAASGSYAPTKVAPSVGTNITYGTLRHFHITRGDFLALANNFVLCDGYPMVRADAYRRYCSCPDRGFANITLFSQLLKHGDLLFYDQPIFNHFQNRESLSVGLPEPWFYDSHSSDIEIAFGCIPDPPLPPDVFHRARSSCIQNVYLQSARMCRITRDYLLMWTFLQRAKAVGGVTEACLIECERHFLFDVILQRICRLIGDTGAKTVTVADTPLLAGLRKALQQTMPEVEFVLRGADTHPVKPADIDLVERFEPNATASQGGPILISFHDLLANLRLTTQPLQIRADSETIGFAIESSLPADPGFSMLMVDYGTPKS